MIRRRKKTEQFTQINNAPLRDPNLSLKAKGLLALMMSVSEDWVFHLKWLIKQSKDGRDATRAALKELEEHRYVIRRRVMSPPPKTQFVGWEWLVDDTPILDIDPDSVVVLPPEAISENPNDDGAPRPMPILENADIETEIPDLLETRQSASGDGIPDLLVSRPSGIPSDGKPAPKNIDIKNIDLKKTKERETRAQKQIEPEIEVATQSAPSSPDGEAANAAGQNVTSPSQVPQTEGERVETKATTTKKVPPAAADKVSTSETEAYLRRKLSNPFIDRLLEELQPLGVDRRTDWFALPLARVQELEREAQATHVQHKVKVPTRMRDLLDDECRRINTPIKPKSTPADYAAEIEALKGDDGPTPADAAEQRRLAVQAEIEALKRRV